MTYSRDWVVRPPSASAWRWCSASLSDMLILARAVAHLHTATAIMLAQLPLYIEREFCCRIF